MISLSILGIVLAAAALLGGIGILLWSRGQRDRAAAARVRNGVLIGCIGLLLCAALAGTVDELAPEVSGVVAEIRTIKRQVRYRVTTKEGSLTVPGEDGPKRRCRVGSKLHKPAWTTAYTCDGAEAGPAGVGLWIGIVVQSGLALAAFATARHVMASRRDL